MCAFDNGIHCPERCGLCRRAFADPERSTTVAVQVAVDQPVHEFEPMQFRQKFADAVAISVNSIQMELSAGSTIVDMTLSTVSGSDADAQSLNAKIASTFPDASSAASTLGVPVLSLTSNVAAASPVAPPSPPSPEPSPPPIPSPPKPSTPPPSPVPSPSSTDDGNSQLFAIALASVVGALVLAVVVFVCCCMRSEPKPQQSGYRAPLMPPAVVVYAESAFQSQTLGDYAKLA